MDAPGVVPRLAYGQAASVASSVAGNSGPCRSAREPGIASLRADRQSRRASGIGPNGVQRDSAAIAPHCQGTGRRGRRQADLARDGGRQPDPDVRSRPRGPPSEAPGPRVPQQQIIPLRTRRRGQLKVDVWTDDHGHAAAVLVGSGQQCYRPFRTGLVRCAGSAPPRVVHQSAVDPAVERRSSAGGEGDCRAAARARKSDSARLSAHRSACAENFRFPRKKWTREACQQRCFCPLGVAAAPLHNVPNPPPGSETHHVFCREGQTLSVTAEDEHLGTSEQPHSLPALASTGSRAAGPSVLALDALAYARRRYYLQRTLDTPTAMRRTMW